jgi:hypothetical protein
MICKNCNSDFELGKNFCPDCGSKVIKNRLSFKNLFDQINEQFFSIDNKLFTTIKDLLINPEIVIDGYINGVRKKYVDVIQFLTISLTLFGFQFFIIKKFFSETFIQTSTSGNKEIDELTAKFSEGFLDYMGIISILFIPIMAIVTYTIYLNKYKHNYVEHIVINTFIVAEYTILTFLVFMILMVCGVDSQINFLISSVLSYFYIGYSFKKIYNLSVFETIWKTIVVIMFYSIISIIILFVIGVIVGVLFKLKN